MAAASEVTKAILYEMWDARGGLCAVTNCPMTYDKMNGGLTSNVSLDRIDNRGGYTVGNMRLVCRAVNYAKNAMSDKEMVEWAKAIANGPIAAGLPQCS